MTTLAMFNLTWVKIKEPRTAALLHGGSQLIPHYESQEFYGNSNDVIFDIFLKKWIGMKDFLDL
jgi:hypothetical protein